MSFSPTFAGITAATVTVLAAGGGLAYAGTSHTGSSAATVAVSSSASPSAAAHGKGGAAHRRSGLLRRGIHGTVVLHNAKGDRTVDFQRGEVTAVTPAGSTSGERVTITSVDHYRHTYVLTSASRVREHGAAASAGTLVVGAKVGVLARRVGAVDDVTVIRIAVPRTGTRTRGTGAQGSVKGSSAGTGAATRGV